MRTLSIDIECYSDISIKCGVGKYVDTPNFQILLFGYAFDDEEVQIIDLAQGEKMPKKLMEALNDGQTLKTAYNAAFEVSCINKYFNMNLNLFEWKCTMVGGAMVGLPLLFSLQYITYR